MGTVRRMAAELARRIAERVRRAELFEQPGERPPSRRLPEPGEPAGPTPRRSA